MSKRRRCARSPASWRSEAVRRCLACEARFEGDSWTCATCGAAPTVIDSFTTFAPALTRDGGGFEADAFALLAEIEQDSFWFRSRNRLIVWMLRRHFPAAARFLEVGCGTGFVLRGVRAALPDLSLSGSEMYSEALTFARDRVGDDAALYQMDARDIPFREEFDVIGAFDVLEHIAEDELVLAQMHGATRPGGGILVTVPQHPRLWSPYDDYAHHVRRYRRAELVEKVERAGFSVERVTSFVAFLLPLMAASRLRVRRRGEIDLSADLSCPPRLDAALERVLSLELGLIRRGHSLRAGGSLVVAARRRA
jgi:SAM-dependent methyltransferase